MKGLGVKRMLILPNKGLWQKCPSCFHKTPNYDNKRERGRGGRWGGACVCKLTAWKLSGRSHSDQLIETRLLAYPRGNTYVSQHRATHTHMDICTHYHTFTSPIKLFPDEVNHAVMTWNPDLEPALCFFVCVCVCVVLFYV